MKWYAKSCKQCKYVSDLPFEKVKESSKYPCMNSDLSIFFKKSTTSKSILTCIAAFSGNRVDAWAYELRLACKELNIKTGKHRKAFYINTMCIHFYITCRKENCIFINNYGILNVMYVCNAQPCVSVVSNISITIGMGLHTSTINLDMSIKNGRYLRQMYCTVAFLAYCVYKIVIEIIYAFKFLHCTFFCRYIYICLHRYTCV